MTSIRYTILALTVILLAATRSSTLAAPGDVSPEPETLSEEFDFVSRTGVRLYFGSERHQFRGYVKLHCQLEYYIQDMDDDMLRQANLHLVWRNVDRDLTIASFRLTSRFQRDFTLEVLEPNTTTQYGCELWWRNREIYRKSDKLYVYAFGNNVRCSDTSPCPGGMQCDVVHRQCVCKPDHRLIRPEGPCVSVVSESECNTQPCFKRRDCRCQLTRHDVIFSKGSYINFSTATDAAGFGCTGNIVLIGGTYFCAEGAFQVCYRCLADQKTIMVRSLIVALGALSGLIMIALFACMLNRRCATANAESDQHHDNSCAVEPQDPAESEDKPPTYAEVIRYSYPNGLPPEFEFQQQDAEESRRASQVVDAQTSPASSASRSSLDQHSMAHSASGSSNSSRHDASSSHPGRQNSPET